MIDDEIEQFVAANSGASIEFGTEKQAPSDEWIQKAEQALGCNLPRGYRWFLAKYGGGEIHGDEIFSIYQLPFDGLVGGDVVAQTLQKRKGGLILDTDIAICTTDYGEVFVLAAQSQRDDDWAVLRITGKNREPYAKNFGEFIVKFVGDAAV